MDAKRGQESQWRFKRQRESLCQKAGDEPEASAARGRQTPRLFLRPDGGHEVKAHQREDGKRPEFPYQQKSEGMELLKWISTQSGQPPYPL